MSDKSSLINDLRKLLVGEVVANQENLCAELDRIGHQVNQSKISRLLHKINAIKVKGEQGDFVYRLPHDVMPPSLNATLSELIIDIVSNETTIIIKTSPGSASVIARILDYKQCQILGTIAGDDTILVTPQSIKKIKTTTQLITQFLYKEK